MTSSYVEQFLGKEPDLRRENLNLSIGFGLFVPPA